MKLQQIPRKIVGRLLYLAFRLFGWDLLSQARINYRSDLREIGTRYGGWVVPANLLDGDSICYCVGCGEDISFDIGLIDQFACDVYGFDPTPRAIKYVKEVAGKNAKYHFLEIGLWDREDTLKFYAPKNPKQVSYSLLNLQKTKHYIEIQVRRLQRIMEELGHEKIDLLKMDIEGAEYKVIESIIEDKIDIKVLCVEYDECAHPLDGDYKQRIRTSVNSLLENGYSLVCSQSRGNYTFVKDA
ncbi:MAG: FkbM family methyltransferase [Fidelibacterota bacterium]|nr:MAG: FkbM family methyltransferase [Candidatus Neomarinimicrobiota bacterium]